MKRTLLFLFLVLLAPALRAQTPRPEYPRPQFERSEWINLNGPWSYTLDPAGTGLERGFPQSQGFDSTILVPFAPESRLSGVAHTDFIEHLWYQRPITIPKAWSGKKILLNFGAVYYRADIYLDGEFITRHIGGSSSFSVDLTPWAKPDTTQSLVVYVRSDLRHRLQPAGKQSTRYASHVCNYTRTTGIWQTVWLEAVHPQALRSAQLTTDIDNARIVIRPDFYATGATRLRATLFDNGKRVASAESVTATDAPLILSVKNPKLWSPDSPHLYDLLYEVTDENGTVIDRVRSYAGMRKIHTEGNRLFLNNQPLYLRMVLDQGYYPESQWTAPSDSALRNDILLAKAVGFNGARLHQKVFEERFHYWADHLGYLTCGEMNSWGLDYNQPLAASIFLPEWCEVIQRDRNHPSIIMWVPLNEQNNVDRVHFPHFSEVLYQTTKAYDPSRPVLTTSGGAHYRSDLFSCHLYHQDPEALRKELWNDGKLFQGHRFEVVPHSQYNTGSNFPTDSNATRWMTYSGQIPYLFDEFGGIAYSERHNSGGWGYGGAESREAFYRRVESLVDVVLELSPMISGFCYTQLTDVEQEQNGLYYYDRTPKFDAEKLKAIFSKEIPQRDGPVH